MSRVAGVPAGWFVVPEFLMFLAIGYLLFHRFGFDRRFFIVLLGAALSESTIGWGVWMLMGAGRVPSVTAGFIIFSAAVAMGLNTAFGILGGWIAKLCRTPPIGRPSVETAVARRRP